MKGYIKQYSTRKRLKLLSNFGSKCQNPNCDCKDLKKLQFAHIRPTRLNGMGRGRIDRIRDVEKNKSCYTLLCEDCHKKFDKNEITIIELNLFEFQKEL